MRSSLLLSVFLAGATAVLSTPSSNDQDTYSWTAPLARFYQEVDRTIQSARSSSDFPNPPSCNLSTAELPEAPRALPPPDQDTYLRHIAIGRGVQNYTCENDTSTPTAIGAVASLYNASCTQCNFPALGTLMTNLVIHYPLPSDPTASLSPAQILFSGHHYFDEKTPIFDLNTSPSSQYGFAAVEKDDATDAPPDAPKGLEGETAVKWLKLNTVEGTTDGVRHVYRVNTVGGSPPETCEGMELEPGGTVFSVEYAAQYWFYAEEDGSE